MDTGVSNLERVAPWLLRTERSALLGTLALREIELYALQVSTVIGLVTLETLSLLVSQLDSSKRLRTVSLASTVKLAATQGDLRILLLKRELSAPRATTVLLRVVRLELKLELNAQLVLIMMVMVTSN